MFDAPAPIEDYALIGDAYTAALVSRAGSIDWLCLPDFDSAACFAALLGDSSHGRWLLRPTDPGARVTRRYRGHSLVLETTFEAADGTVRVIDCMSPREHDPDLCRVIEGVSGRVRMRCELVPRFDYGSISPWVRSTDDGALMVAGPDALQLHTEAPIELGDGRVDCEVTVPAGARIRFLLDWHPSHAVPNGRPDVEGMVAATERWWQEWAGRCTYDGDRHDLVLRSLVTLKALTYSPTGGILAAPTTSLPELIGGPKNWDYRFCWVRDATFTLYALLVGGYVEEAAAWRDWLLRAVAGSPQQLHLLYGLRGERRAPELELDWLPGYEGSRPVRIGNAASYQFQLDVYGELIDAVYQARRSGMEPESRTWQVQQALLEFLEGSWREPDNSIWEFRGERRHYTHSKVMAWVAFDRAIKTVEEYGVDGPVDRWRRCRDAVRDEVLHKGWNDERGAFCQSYGSSRLDASLLMVPLVGFLPATDPRVRSTVDAIQRELCEDGFVRRHPTTPQSDADVVPREEGTFVLCTFWLADNLALMGRTAEARSTFDRVVSICNDVGLLAEEYDPRNRRFLGNFPQAFSHIGLVNTARNLSRAGGPASRRHEERSHGS